MTDKCVMTISIGQSVFVGAPQDGKAKDVADAWKDITDVLEGFIFETVDNGYVVFNKDNCKQMIVSFKDCA